MSNKGLMACSDCAENIVYIYKIDRDTHMVRIIALSDTHLEDGKLPPAVAMLAKGADIILHAGDFVSAQAYAALADLGRLEAVRGNSDCSELKRLLPERKIITVDEIQDRSRAHGLAWLGPGRCTDDGQRDGCAGFGLWAYSSSTHRERQKAAYLSRQHDFAQNVGTFGCRAGDY